MILKPGRNCWRLEAADKVSFLIDGAAYFRALRETLYQAEQAVYIIGWDIDSRLRLLRQAGMPDDGLPERLGDLLNTLAAMRRGLHIYVLVWDFAMIYALDREWLPIYKLGWKTHRRLHFRMDDHHPIGASHHQKIVVVDDRVAFVGGMDLSKRRWDTPLHEAESEQRTDTEGERYPPVHDVQMMTGGAAAAALGRLARERWHRATGKRLTPPGPGRTSAYWPGDIPPDLRQVAVGIARTEPAFDGREGIREVEQLYLDSVAGARHSIYIENQYLTSRTITGALAARLSAKNGPEVVMVLPMQRTGWLEHEIMDSLRARAIRCLREADRYGRLGIYYPSVPGTDPRLINVHAKLIIVDDDFVSVGSANLNNRSMGFDTECNLAVETAAGEARAGISHLRNRLLAEHLGVPVSTVRESLATAGGLKRAVESLRGGERTLQPLETPPEGGADYLSNAPFIDPERPVEPDRLIEGLLSTEPRRKIRRYVGGTILLGALLLMAAAWRWTPMGSWLDEDKLLALFEFFAASPIAPLIAIAVYLVGGFIMMPVTLLFIVTVVAFGPLNGFIYSLTGALLSAAATYAVGYKLGRHTVRHLAGARLNKLSKRLRRQGVPTVMFVRMVPIAPFTVINVVAGATHVRFRDYALGTILGMTPGLAAIAILTDRVGATLQRPDTWTVLTLFGVAALIAAGLLFLRHWLKRWFER